VETPEIGEPSGSARWRIGRRRETIAA